MIDARLHIPDWNATGYDDSAWANAAVGIKEGVVLSAQMLEPDRIVETLKPVGITEAKGSFTYDMGRNFTGWVDFKLRNGREGQVIRITTSNRKGHVLEYDQESQYIHDASGEGTFRHRFNYQAGRWITIHDLGYRPELEDLRGLMITNDLTRIGRFQCSEPLFNDIYETDIRTFQANTVNGVTMDCPHRERFGYGEIQLACSWGCSIPHLLSASYWRKVSRDWADVQREDGFINTIAPHTYSGAGGTLWNSALVTLNRESYHAYADLRQLRDAYPAMKRWVDFLNASVSKDGLLVPYDRPSRFLGDWATPHGSEYGNTPEAALFNNCVYAYNLIIITEAAKALGHAEDATLYQKRLAALRENAHRHFYDAEKKRYIDGRQLAMAFPLYVGITPESEREAVMAGFIEEITARKPYLDTGSSGLPILLKFLVEDAGRADILANILKRTEARSLPHQGSHHLARILGGRKRNQPDSYLLHRHLRRLHPRHRRHPARSRSPRHEALPDSTRPRWRTHPRQHHRRILLRRDRLQLVARRVQRQVRHHRAPQYHGHLPHPGRLHQRCPRIRQTCRRSHWCHTSRTTRLHPDPAPAFRTLSIHLNQRAGRPIRRLIQQTHRMKASRVTIAVILTGLSSLAGAVTLEDEFQQPPHSAKPWVYWINMDGHFTKEGITADLESMKAAGIAGMIHMDVDVGVPRGKVPFMSETWQANFRHAVLECERLGLEFTTITGPGWTGTGGPWVRANESMQHLLPVSVNVTGPSAFDAILPKAEPRVSAYHKKQTPALREALAAFHEDVAVYAFPRTDPVIENIDEKALFVRNPFTSMKGVRTHFPSPAVFPETDKSQIIDPQQIIDLTDRLQPDGRLQWEVPPGEWTILRMARRSTGANTRPAPAAGLGFESNKFDKKALESHFEAYFDPLLNSIGPRPRDRTTGFTGLDADSWEMGAQNWTPGFREEFKNRRNYDPWP